MTSFCSGFSFLGFSASAALALGMWGCAASTASPETAADQAAGAAEAASVQKAAAGPLHSQVRGTTVRGLTTMGVTRLGNALYVMGGYFGQPHDYSKDFQSDDFARMDVTTGTWEQLPSAGGIQSVILVNDGKSVYRVGGMRALNAAGEPENLRSSAEVARFDPASKTWAAMTDLPEARSSHQAVIDGNTLYVVGGWALAGGSYDSTWSETMASCDLSQPTCTWKSSPVPFKTRAMGAAVHHGKMYVVGGLTPDKDTAEVWVGDLATGAWAPGPAMPNENMTPTAAVWGDRLFASGGDGNVYRLSADAKSWETAGALQFSRMFHQLVAGDDGLWVVGGVPGKVRGARVRHVEHVLATQNAGTVWTIESQSTAKNRQGIFLNGTQLYVFGGNNSLEQHDFDTKNFVDASFRLDLGNLDWKPLDNFPAARQSMQAVVTGNDEKRTAYVVGGFGYSKEKPTSQPDVFAYDLKSAKWSKLPKGLPSARSQFGLAEWNDSLWVLGGLDYDDARKDPEKFKHPTAVLRMDLRDPAQGFSEAGFELKEKRRAFAGTQIGARFYLTGGIREDFQPVTSCEVLDLEQKKSSEMACPSQHRLGGELVAIEGKLYLVGGSVKGSGEDREPSKLIEVYDPASNQWSTLTDQPPLETMTHVRAFAYFDQLLLYSAQQKDARAQVALLNPKALAAGERRLATFVVQPSPPLPVVAKGPAAAPGKPAAAPATPATPAKPEPAAAKPATVSKR